MGNLSILPSWKADFVEPEKVRFNTKAPSLDSVRGNDGVLELGSTGSSVAYVQQKLDTILKHYLPFANLAGLDADGYYGVLTYRTVLWLQQKFGIQAQDGKIDEATLAKIEGLVRGIKTGEALAKDSVTRTSNGTISISLDSLTPIDVDPLAPGQNQSIVQPRGPLDLVAAVGVGAPNDSRDVDRVQMALVPEYLGVGDFVRGEFGETTERALLAFLGNPTAACDQRITPTGAAADRLAAHESAQLNSVAPPPPPFALVTDPFIQSSVGANGDERRGDNVKAVQVRLRELGFPVEVDGQFGPKTETYIRLFASIVEGKEQHHNATATLEPYGTVTQALFSPDAPTWVQVKDGGIGWKSVDRDHYDYAVNKTLTVLEQVGAAYQQEFLSTHPTSSLIKVNDVSREDGKVVWRNGAPEHRSHRNGLDVDISLPKKAGSDNFDGGTRTDWADYDQEAAFAIIKAFAENPDVERVIVGDKELRDRALASGHTWATKLLFDEHHSNHLHVDIAPMVGRT